MKRTVRTLLAFALALVLIVSASAVADVNLESALPIVTEPLSVTIGVVPHTNIIFADFDVDKFWNVRYFKDVTGLDITWEVYDPASAGETISLMMASDEMPDLLINTWDINAVNNYGVIQNMLYPIETLFEYMPTFTAIMEKQPELRAVLTTPDGHVYGFPKLGDGKYSYPLRFWLKDSWLEAVGKDSPTTLDEMFDVLCAFRDQDANGNGDPNDDIPFGGSWDEEYSERNYFLTSFGLAAGGLTVDYTPDADENDRAIIYAPYAPEYKDYLAYMKKLWDEKLFDPDMFTQSQVQANAKINDDLVGIWGGSNPSGVVTSIADADKYYDAVAVMKGLDGNDPAIGYYSLIYGFSGATISAKCDPEKAAALANLMDYYYTPEWQNFCWFGPEYGSEYDYDNIGTYYHESRGSYGFVGADQTGLSHWVYKVTYINFWETPGYHTVGQMYYDQQWAIDHPDSLVAEKIEKNGGVFQDYEKKLNEKVVPYYVEGIPPMFLSEDDVERASLLETQLNDYVRNAEVKFICGELNLDADYDAFLSTLESYGVKELEEIYNTYYSIYKANK